MPSAYPKEYKACIAAIIKARKDKGLTQQELADDLGKAFTFLVGLFAGVSLRRL